MEANSLVPKLRFRQFTEKQSVCRVNKIAAINPKNSELPENFIYIDLESVKKGVLIKNNVLTKSSAPSRAQRLLETGDILYQSVRPYQKNNYLFELKGSYVASTGYLQIKTKMNYAFLYHYFHNNKFVNNVIKMCTGANYPTISSKDFGNILVSLPPLAEQNKIASFLSSVDKKINLLNKKKALLESYKKGVMQKIFSQEIRFKDEDGKDFPDWEEKRIREVFEERNEKNFIDMELLSISINKGIFKQSESNKKDNSNSDKSNYKRVLIGDIAYNSMRMWQGASAVSILNGIISPAYTVLKSNDFNCSQYFGYLFKMSFMIQTFQKHSQGLTSDTWNLKYRMISPIKINIPLLEEQNKIAEFLSSIDKKIELVDFQLERNKEFKKGLLQQMFV